MLSHRHPGEHDPKDAAILDAARECVLAVGVRRTTAADIARRAGISRMTLYRRFPDVGSVVQDLMTRQFGTLLRQAREEHAAAPSGRERVVGALDRGLELLDSDPVLHRILDVDPELLLPYVVQRVGAFQAAVIATLAADLKAGMADGSVRLAEPERLAAGVEQALRGHVLAAHAHDRALDAAAARAELREMVDRYLRP